MKVLYCGLIGFGVGLFFEGLGNVLGIDFGLRVPVGAALALAGLGLLVRGED